MEETAWLDERQQRAWRLFLRMQMHLRSRIHQELQRHSGLSEADYEVLVVLSESPHGRMRVFEIGDELQWETSRLSHHLTRMERRGLVRREKCPTDQRGAYIVLTDAGRDAIVAAAPRHVADVRRYFIDAITPEQLDELADIAERVLEALDALPDDAATTNLAR